MFFLGFWFSSSLSWGQIQYNPLSSAERHELSSGFSVSKKNGQKSLISLPVFFLKYGLYFPEIESVLTEPYKKAFIPGLQMGINLFQAQQIVKNYKICGTGSNILSAAYYFGIKGKSSYFEALQPFAELGLARSFCYTKNFSKISTAKIKLRHYLSYGIFFSLKIFDKAPVYALDQDYGINDLGIKMECLHYYSKKTTDKSINFCQFGLQMSF